MGQCCGRTKKETSGNFVSGRRNPPPSCALSRDVLLCDRKKYIPATSVYIWGSNKYGILGNEKRGGENAIPKEMKTTWMSTKFLNADVGRSHVCLRTTDEKIYGWGLNDHDQLGLSASISFVPRPQIVAGYLKNKIEEICCGDNFTLALDSEGNVWSVGENKRGQLGIGTNAFNVTQFQRVKKLGDGSPVRYISAGEMHGAVLNVYGKLFVFGDNTKGQLGRPSEEELHSDPVTPSYAAAHGDEEEDMPSCVRLACGTFCTAVLTSERRACLLAGTLGKNRRTNAFCDIVKERGKLSTKEDVDDDVDETDRTSTKTAEDGNDEHVRFDQVAAGEHHLLLLSANDGASDEGGGKLYTYGEGWAACCETGQTLTTPTVVPRIESEVVQIAAGAIHSMILTRNGLVYTWGDDDCGQLGLTSRLGGKLRPHLIERFETITDDSSNLPFVVHIAAGRRSSIALADGTRTLDSGALKTLQNFRRRSRKRNSIPTEMKMLEKRLSRVTREVSDLGDDVEEPLPVSVDPATPPPPPRDSWTRPEPPSDMSLDKRNTSFILTGDMNMDDLTEDGGDARAFNSEGLLASGGGPPPPPPPPPPPLP